MRSVSTDEVMDVCAQMTGFGRAQVTRLISGYQQTGQVVVTP
jgi:hypothetical protein